jgi:hypothetical protein
MEQDLALGGRLLPYRRDDTTNSAAAALREKASRSAQKAVSQN